MVLFFLDKKVAHGMQSPLTRIALACVCDTWANLCLSAWFLLSLKERAHAFHGCAGTGVKLNSS
jgi:hypothetical protein